MIVESTMFFGIGFLLAALSVLVVAPLVHGRAARLTERRLEASIPLSMAEVQAEKDLQRAEFAVSTRRLEVNVEQLRIKSASQLAELGRKSDAINRLKAEVGALRQQLRATQETVTFKTSASREAQRQLSKKEKELAMLMSDFDERSSIADAQKVEIVALKNRLEELQERLTIGSNKIKVGGSVAPPVRMVVMDAWQRPSRSGQYHEGGTIHLAPDVRPTAELEKVPMDSSKCSPRHGQRDQGDIGPFVPKDGLTAEPIDFSQSPPPSDRHRKGDMVHLVSTGWPIAEPGRVPSHSSQSPIPNGQHNEGPPYVPNDGLTAKPIDCWQSPSPNDWHHEGDIIHLASKVSPTAEAGRMPSEASKSPNGQHDESLPFVPKDGLTAEPIDCSQSPSPNDWYHEGDIIHLASKVSPTAGAGRVPSGSSQSPIPNGQHDEGLAFVPKDGMTAESIDCSQSPSPNDWPHEGDIIHLASKVSPTAGTGRVPSDSSQSPIPNGQHDEGLAFMSGLRVEPIDSLQSPSPSGRHQEGVSFAPKDRLTGERGKVSKDSLRSPLPNHRCHEGDVTTLEPKVWQTDKEGWRGARPSDPDREQNTSDQRIGTHRKESDFSDRLRAVESSIREVPRASGVKNHQFISNESSIGRRTFRTVARFSIAALIGVGGLTIWHSYSNEAMEKIGTRVLSLGSLSSVATTQSPPASAPATVATSPDLVQQLKAMPHDLAVVQRGVEQLAKEQEQMARHIATLQAAELHFKKTTSFPHLRRREKLIPWPETRPATIPGWTLREFEIANGTVVLEGPNGVWRATRGDTVPGVGRVESIVRWGSRLIVATSNGLISTP